MFHLYVNFSGISFVLMEFRGFWSAVCVVPHPSKPQWYQMPPPLPSLFILNISGQPSDSAGGTFKSFLLNEAKAGNSKYIST